MALDNEFMIFLMVVFFVASGNVAFLLYLGVGRSDSKFRHLLIFAFVAVSSAVLYGCFSAGWFSFGSS
jgi:hypothetical protein